MNEKTLNSTIPLGFTARSVLRIALNKAQTVFSGLILICLTASFATGSHIHSTIPVEKKPEVVDVPAQKPLGLGGQFASRHMLHDQSAHDQSERTPDDADGTAANLFTQHSMTHMHEVLLTALSFTVAALACFCGLRGGISRCLRGFALFADIFHPPKFV